MTDPRTLADEIGYPTITIIVDDPATGMTTTITGKAKVDITTVAPVLEPGPPLDLSMPYERGYGKHSLRLVADWQEEAGKRYVTTYLPTLVGHQLTDGTLCTVDGPHPRTDCTA